MSRCADQRAKRALRALFTGELDAEGFTHLRAHAATCDECREAYDKLGRVDSALEGRALSGNREALLEKALFARLGAAPKPARAPAPERERSFLPRFLMPAAVGLSMAAAAAVLLVLVRPEPPPSEWQARGGGDAGTSAWGIRVFCVGSEGVRAEAKPGGTLVCGEGASVQFSYTAPQAARLAIEATSASGEPLRFFPREGEAAEVIAGVDVVLAYSTPVQPGWLSAPLEVRASFTDARGQVLSQTRLTLSPR
jgi:anti-sigma factor RsiW